MMDVPLKNQLLMFELVKLVISDEYEKSAKWRPKNASTKFCTKREITLVWC